MIRLREVCGLEYAEDLAHLQRVILPMDQPYDTARGWWWLVWANDVPVAFAGISPTYADARMGYLCRAGVLPELRGKGLQKRLIRARMRHATRIGMHSVVTDTAGGNHASSNSLIACGFRLYSPATKWAAPGALYWRRSALARGGFPVV